MVNLRGVVFDVDDTLYLERDYVRSGLTAVAEVAAPVLGLPVATVQEDMWRDFLDGVRGSTFDRLLLQYPALGEKVSVDEMIATYREHRPSIRVLPGMADIVERLAASGRRIGVITDGPLTSQRLKVDALGISTFADPVVLTDSWGRTWWKPHPRAYLEVSRIWGSPPDELVYVADNPMKDFDAPVALGWSAVRLRLPGQLHESVDLPDGSPVVEVHSVDELARLILHAETSPSPAGRLS